MPLDETGAVREGHTSVLDEFLDQAALESGDHQAEGDGNCVQLMTLHSAKGLEFPIVFMTGMEEGLFPNRMSAEEPGRMEEERRLCYVGITRAMRQLAFTFAETRRLHGTDSYNRPSRFIGEVPASLLQEVRMRGRGCATVRVARGLARRTPRTAEFPRTTASYGLVSACCTENSAKASCCRRKVTVIAPVCRSTSRVKARNG